MKLYRKYTFRIEKRESLGSLFQRVTDVLNQFGQTSKVYFYFEDQAIGSVSACDRLIKRFPVFESFAFTHAEARANPPKIIKSISNFNNSWDISYESQSATAISTEILSNVAVGVPRSFPFHYSHFIFDNVSLLNTSEPDTGDASSQVLQYSSRVPRSYNNSAIVLDSHWWVSRREHHLTVIVALPIPTAGEEVVLLPEKTKSFIQAFGKIAEERLEIVYTQQEATERQAVIARLVSVTTRYNQNIGNIIQTLPLPHSLPSVEQVGLHGEEFKIGSMKDVLVKYFKSLGYCYQAKRSGHGIYSLTKLTPNNNELEIYLDVGSWSRSVTASFSFNGMSMSGSVGLPVSKNAIDVAQYPILSIEQWRQIVENLVVVVNYLEKTFAVEADEVSGSTPRWYAAC